METKLNPCPFCGAKNLVLREDGIIRCHRCDCTGPLSDWAPFIVGGTDEMWNRRHHPEPTDADVERVAKAIYDEWDHGILRSMDGAMSVARAAIAALRETKP